MGLTEKQILFCKEVSKGKNGSSAYAIAFENTTDLSCRSAASKLLKRADIRQKIQEFKDFAREIVKSSQKSALETETVLDICDTREKLHILSQIARGQIPLTKPIVVDGVIEYVEFVPDWMDRKNAIAELNKMVGDYSADKVEHKIVTKLPSWLQPK